MPNINNLVHRIKENPVKAVGKGLAFIVGSVAIIASTQALLIYNNYLINSRNQPQWAEKKVIAIKINPHPYDPRPPSLPSGYWVYLEGMGHPIFFLPYSWDSTVEEGDKVAVTYRRGAFNTLKGLFINDYK